MSLRDRRRAPQLESLPSTGRAGGLALSGISLPLIQPRLRGPVALTGKVP